MRGQPPLASSVRAERGANVSCPMVGRWESIANAPASTAHGRRRTTPLRAYRWVRAGPTDMPWLQRECDRDQADDDPARDSRDHEPDDRDQPVVDRPGLDAPCPGFDRTRRLEQRRLTP